MVLFVKGNRKITISSVGRVLHCINTFIYTYVASSKLKEITNTKEVD